MSETPLFQTWHWSTGYYNSVVPPQRSSAFHFPLFLTPIFNLQSSHRIIFIGYVPDVKFNDNIYGEFP